MSTNTPVESTKQPPRTIRIKRPRDETPVTSLYLDDSSPGDSKRIKTSTPQTPAYIFRLAHTIPTPFQPVATTSSSPIPRSDRPPPVLDARKLRPKSSTEQPSRETSGSSTPLKRKLAGDVDEDDGRASPSSSQPGTTTPSTRAGTPGTPTDQTRPGAVRRFVLTRETKRKRMHPYKAVFERLHDAPAPLNPTAVDGTTSVDTALAAIDAIPAPPPSPPRKRKLPGIRKDPVERARIQKLQSEQEGKESAKAPAGDTGEFDLSEEMRRMVLDYLEEDSRNALGGLPATPSAVAKPVDRIGGGLGGGTWDDTKEEDDKDFVYDVYIREEVTAENAKAPHGEDVGVIVFRGDDDEEWWYENADDDDADNFAFDTDDEDSNAEDYIANEYPDEEEYEWASDDEDRGIYDDDEDDMVEYSGSHPLYVGPNMGRRTKRTTDSDEEYDLENDLSEEEEGERMKRFVKGVMS